MHAVQVRDERGKVLCEESTFYRIQQAFAHGFTIAGSHFRYLGSSASQLRSRAGYFTTADCSSIHRHILGGHTHEPYHKQLSYLSLFLTADTKTSAQPTVPPPWPDVKTGSTLLTGWYPAQRLLCT
eukprot:7178870-Pyramimonas_sp.AAC.1